MFARAAAYICGIIIPWEHKHQATGLLPLRAFPINTEIRWYRMSTELVQDINAPGSGGKKPEDDAGTLPAQKD